MAARVLRTALGVRSTVAPLYTGGPIAVASDGSKLFCPCGDDVHVIALPSGQLLRKLKSPDDPISALVAHPNGQLLLCATRALLVKIYNIETGRVERSFKAHRLPVLCMAIDSTGTLVATGSSDNTVKVWDIEQGHLTHNLTGHTGIVLCIAFHPNTGRLQLFSASEDHSARVWDLNTSVGVPLENHMSAVTSLTFSPSGWMLVTGGRDGVLNMWNLRNNSHIKTVPTFEAVEAVVFLPDDAAFKGRPAKVEKNKEGGFVATAGEKGRVRIWDLATRTAVAEEERESASILHLLSLPNSPQLLCVTSDHNFLFKQLDTLNNEKLLVGYNDEVTDIRFVLKGSELAVATNSAQIRLFDKETHACRMLSAHTDTVLALDATLDGAFLASAGKDQTARTMRCVAVCIGHTEAVAAVAFSRTKLSFAITGSQDKTIKLWDLSKVADAEGEAKAQARFTQRAHDRDVNSVAVSPNDKLFATGSQDKTAKLWATADMTLIGTLKGHKRGVWCVEFSPVDQVLLTSSADKTIKLWSIKDFSCLRTFEGHETAVLRAAFITTGMQVASVSADGLLKMWTIKTSECVTTIDAHNDRTWALTTYADGAELASGGADSLVRLWEDRTAVEKEEAAALAEQRVLQEQELSNCVSEGKLARALFLGLLLEQPQRIFRIMKDLTAPHRAADLTAALRELSDSNLMQLMKYARDWNTNTRYSLVVQHLLRAVFTLCSPARFERLKAAGAADVLVALLPYTERHQSRIDKLLLKSYVVDSVLGSMLPEAERVALLAPNATRTPPPVPPLLEPPRPMFVRSELMNDEEEEGTGGKDFGGTEKSDPATQRALTRMTTGDDMSDDAVIGDGGGFGAEGGGEGGGRGGQNGEESEEDEREERPRVQQHGSNKRRGGGGRRDFAPRVVRPRRGGRGKPR